MTVFCPSQPWNASSIDSRFWCTSYGLCCFAWVSGAPLRRRPWIVDFDSGAQSTPTVSIQMTGSPNIVEPGVVPADLFWPFGNCEDKIERKIELTFRRPADVGVDCEMLWELNDCRKNFLWRFTSTNEFYHATKDFMKWYKRRSSQTDWLQLTQSLPFFQL